MRVPDKEKTNFFLPRHGNIFCGDGANCSIPYLFGIINLTPDSFSDGGQFSSVESAVKKACILLDEGAFAIDAGGESTRPGALEISAEEEKKRVIPFIRALRKERPQCIISIDTRKASVAASAMEAGADIINDVSAMQFDPDMGKVMAESSASVILMHARGTPQTMKEERFLIYKNVVKEVGDFLIRTTEKAVELGVKKESILLDPGLGFAKTPQQDWLLCQKAEELQKKVCRPLFYAPSRKSFLKNITGELPAAERSAASSGIFGALHLAGIRFLRVHDVKNTLFFLQAFSRAGELSK